ncbi:MAG: hypothetical protein IPF73_03895 [Betaproteobacteria bacterium]|nr:hypothetical protein [Betaproteobacteria bacterium]
MTLDSIFLAARAARLLPVALFVPLVAFAQAPAAPEARPAPAAEVKDAAKEAAPAAQDAASGAATPAARDAAAPAKEATKAASKDAAGEQLPPTGPLAPLAWLSGCWRGEVNKREFREFWQPLRGNLMVGVSRNALPERTISFEYLRLEPRADGVYYVTTSMGKTEAAFKLASTKRDGNDETFTFQRGGTEFPTALAYRRGAGGWLYVEVAGQAQGKDHKVTYPFRRVDCESGEFIRK